MKYKVSGTIELNWDLIVVAESQEEAEVRALGMAMDGYGLGDPVDTPEIMEVEEFEG